MTDRIPFHWYAGQALASLLPYRKKGLIFGPQVCERAAVMPMTKAGFFLGCSLALANESAVEEILTEAGAHQPWRTAFNEIIQDMERRVQNYWGLKVDAATYENLFIDVDTYNSFKDALLTPEDCVVSVGQRVLMGLMFGVLFPEMTLSMLEAWATQQGEWKGLAVGGLRVADFPLLASVKEACERAQSLCEAWQSE